MRSPLLSAILVLAAATAPAVAQDGTRTSYRPHLPQLDDLRPLADMTGEPSVEELAARAQVREYRRQLGELTYRYLGNKKNQELRQKGLEQITEFSDPAAFIPMIEEFSDQEDDVRAAMLGHFESQGEWGQAALAWLVIHGRDETLHYEALKRISKPLGDPALNVIDAGLRSEDDFVANLAGQLAGHLDLTNTIPLLIHGQSRTRVVQEPGDDAWILVGTQRVFVQALIPIIGDGSGAFLPVPGVLTEGVILRVIEAVAVIYRTEMHRTLVAMSTRDWGQSTAHLGYDFEAWRTWYEQEYLPYKKEQALVERMAEEKPRKVEGEDDDNAADRDGS